MTKNNLVRSSRDGDQFHYLWAARRCLKLLSGDDGLVAISIEGPSPTEAADRTVQAGEEVIDIAEYFGSEDIGRATLVRYMQLKHSTHHADEPWTASGLEKTIKGFAKRYAELLKAHSKAELAAKLQCWFVTNRPVSAEIVAAVADAASGASPRYPEETSKLEKFTGLVGDEFATFCKLLHFEDRQDGYWDQRNILFQEFSGYLPDADADAPTQLKELVTRRALSEGERRPTITRADILRVLKTDEKGLFPAECLIAEIGDAVPREQEPDLIQEIIQARAPVIIHASGGVGKSVFASRIGRTLPPGSACVLYDCFGNGQYRSAAGYRHRHRDALVQIANELAGRGLCHPLVPTLHADASAYIKAFVYRLTQASILLRRIDPESLLCVVIDAADNAQMAAEEIGETRSFVRDLIRIGIPDGVRLVFLCRSHRQHHLDPPADAVSIELCSFSRNETDAFLRKTFPDANRHDGDEFHRLSSHNPRVQALALSRGLPLDETLRLLGPNPTSVEAAIGDLLRDAIKKLKADSGVIERDRIEKICAGLATLRPLIPIPVLSAMSGIEEDAIKSFAYDVGRPLLVAGDTIQFFDEPAETWFRETFKPTAGNIAAFVACLKPLATQSAYVASSLPQLMLEGGQFSELVALALSSEALPEGSVLEKRDVELKRLQFALKAALRTRQYVPATKLALKAGGETAGDARQRKILQANTDLTAVFLGLDLIQEIVSRRTFGSGWVGSHHAYEAALLSGRKELVGDARSRLRMAHEWLRNWARMTKEERGKEAISDEDIVELTLVHLNVHGPVEAAESLARWTPRSVSYYVGSTVIRRLIDHGRFAEIDEIARAADNNLCLILAITSELRQVQKAPPCDIILRAFRLIADTRVRLKGRQKGFGSEEPLGAVLPIVEVALRSGQCTHGEAATVLSTYLPSEPPRGLSSRHSREYSQLAAYCLRAALEGKVLELRDLAHAELKAEIDKDNKHSTSRDLQEFQEDIGALLPWHALWASVVLGHVKKEEIATKIKETCAISSKAERIRYRDDSHTSNKIALIWMAILHTMEVADATALSTFNQWKNSLKRPLFTPTLNSLCRACAQTEATRPAALEYAAESYKLTKDERADAESKSDGYLQVARAILTTSKSDAKAYFDEAVEVASKIGDENLARWDAMLYLAERSARANRPAPVAAYDFARSAELTYDYVARDKHFPWEDTVTVLCGLCPSSAITILSRWRDRHFGWHERLLPIAIGNLIEREALDARDALPLIGFRAQWDYGTLAEPVLARCETGTKRSLLGDILYRYVRLYNPGASTLRDLLRVFVKHGIDAKGLTEAISFAEVEEGARKSSEPDVLKRHSEKLPKPRDWNAVFGGVDLTTPNGISRAYVAFKQTEIPWSHEDFFAEALRRVTAGKETDFILALGEFPEFSLYSLRTFLEQVPETWKSRPAIAHALAALLKMFCRRFATEISKNRYYQVIPFDLACSLAGINETELVDIVLSSIGESPDLIATDRLFSLIGLLVIKLSPDEALEVLTYGLDLFKAMLEDKDGDGSWTNALLPPKDVREAVAGYVWAALAAPEAVLRWDAAHTVFEFCRCERQEVIAFLMKMPSTRSGGPYIDAELPFYYMHAFQWLLIALARAAMDAPHVLAPYAEQLTVWALEGPPHVLMRQFAARAALQLIRSGHLADPGGLSKRLRTVNETQLPVVMTKTYDRPFDHGDDPADDDERFYFGMDIGPYWYAPLGRIFAVSQGNIEARAKRVIREDFDYRARTRWDNDGRARRSLYEERHTYHSHGSSPRADDLNFYYAYHAMMVVAGQLLATSPTYRSPDDDEDEFAEWLSRHDLTRKDGRWLSDRRDPEPLERGTWMARDKEHPDRLAVTEDDFNAALGSEEMLNLWGAWSQSDFRRTQSIRVASALVNPGRSASLLRALGSVTDAHDYVIPMADSDMEIDEGSFTLKGWVRDHTRDRRLDEYDRWAGGVSFPPPHPAPFIVELMKLETDSDQRVWNDGSQTTVMMSEVWGHYDEATHHESSNPDRGKRLRVSKVFMASLLEKLDRNLIIEVQIGRRRRFQSYENSEKDDEQVSTRTKLYLFGKDGLLRAA